MQSVEIQQANVLQMVAHHDESYWGAAVRVALSLLRQGHVVFYLTTDRPSNLPLAELLVLMSELSEDVPTLDINTILDGEFTDEQKQLYFYKAFKDEFSKICFRRADVGFSDQIGSMAKKDFEEFVMQVSKFDKCVILIEEFEKLHIWENPRKARDWRIAFKDHEVDKKVKFLQGLAKKYDVAFVAVTSRDDK